MIPDYIKNIRSMHFSLAGEAEAAAYDPKVIASVDAKMLRLTKTLENRSAYFFKLCNIVSMELNLEPDPARSQLLHQELGTNNKLPKLLSNSRNPTLLNIPKIQKGEKPSASQGLGSSATSASGFSPQAVGERPSFQRRLCSEEEANEKRAAIIAMGIPESLEKILPYGYFDKLLDNQRYKSDHPREYHCPRPSFHQDQNYRCVFVCPRNRDE